MMQKQMIIGFSPSHDRLKLHIFDYLYFLFLIKNNVINLN